MTEKNIFAYKLGRRLKPLQNGGGGAHYDEYNFTETKYWTVTDTNW